MLHVFTKMAVANDVILWYQCLMKTLLIVCSVVLLSKDATCLVCHCAGRCPGQNQVNDTCVAGPESGCFSAIEQVLNPETNGLEYERTYGCLPKFMQCKGDPVPHVIPKAIECCSNEDMCNMYLEPVIITASPMYNGDLFMSDDPSDLVVYVAVPSVCIIMLAIIVIILRCTNKKDSHGSHNMDVGKGEGGYLGGHSMKDLIDSNVSSGSGSGPPLLVQRTIGKEVEMIESIGKGSFGEVWKARRQEEFVAVKIFFTSEEAIWKREKDIYNTILLRHENILGFIAADIKGTSSLTQMLLITDYHELGSLHDYLKIHVLDVSTMLKLAHSAACGLSYLHVHIIGKQGKPVIAHRDIRSRNILVKKDRTCAIADFGLAVKHNVDTEKLDIATNTRVGARRYLAPEVLDETLDASNFQAYINTDMYSFALVLWEIVRRCMVNGVVEEYQLPFYEYVPSNVSFEDMKKVVCVDQKRPSMPQYFDSCPTMRTMSQAIEESWKRNSGARLTSLRVEKTLSKLKNNNKG